MPRISIIVAMDKNRGIGKSEHGVGKMLWKIKGDLVRLKNLTSGHVVVLGRKTYDSMAWYYDKSGKPMPGKLYIVVTHDKNYKPSRESAAVANSVEEALKLAKEKELKEVFIIGGAQIFEQTLPLVDRLYLTIIDNEYAADAFFPNYSAFKKVVSEEKRKTEEGLSYTWLTLEK